MTNVQTKTNQDKKKGLIYSHDEASVLATVITTFNEHMEHVVEEHGHSILSPTAFRQASIKLVMKPKPQPIKR